MRQKTVECLMEQFRKRLEEDEKSEATIVKYVHDARHFLSYLEKETEITKALVITYKQHLAVAYKLSSANSKLAAVNCFLRTTGYGDCVVKTFRMQRETFRDKELTRKEYLLLLETARKKGKRRLFLLMETIGATGIRVSELPFITVEALKIRRASVSLKGKTRMVILPEKLCRELGSYAEDRQIKSGSIFVTRNGRVMDRSNILHEMKALCREAGVEEEKVFPHNFRHLFAVTYYNAERDICHLADQLGHSNINTTRIYTLTSCEEQERQIDRLGLLT